MCACECVCVCVFTLLMLRRPGKRACFVLCVWACGGGGCWSCWSDIPPSWAPFLNPWTFVQTTIHINSSAMSHADDISLACEDALSPLASLSRLKGLTLQARGCEDWSEEGCVRALGGLTGLRALHVIVGSGGAGMQPQPQQQQLQGSSGSGSGGAAGVREGSGGVRRPGVGRVRVLGPELLRPFPYLSG